MKSCTTTLPLVCHATMNVGDQEAHENHNENTTFVKQHEKVLLNEQAAGDNHRSMDPKTESTTTSGSRQDDEGQVPLPTGDGNLMELYESRLRRLREYETRVYSRYSTPMPFASSSRQTAVQPSSRRETAWQVDVKESQAPAPRLNHTQTPLSIEPRPAGSEGLPQIIHVSGESDDGEGLFDDITLSTGVISNPVVDVPTPTTLAQNSPQQPQERLYEERLDDAEEEKNDEDYTESRGNSHGVWTRNTEASTSSSSEIAIKKHSGDANEDSKPDGSTDPNGDGYGHGGAPDSKFGTYNVLVSPDQDDRAVEIALYSAGRPHMRAFHFAWLSFFVAFFTWFAITPLLSEVAISLSLTREEIWTSSTLAVASSAVTRVMIGPVNDIYGARWTMSGTLIFSAIPTALAGLAIQNAASLYTIRFLIGVAGSAFVTCQFWTTTMFTAEVAGTANSLSAGWGNLGGGVAQIVMGALLFPLLKVLYGGEGYGSSKEVYADDENPPEYDRAADLAWRTAMLFPALLCIFMAYVCIKYGDDCPKGNFRKRKALGLMPIESTKDALRRGASNWNTWLLFVQYGCCFGVEITMTNAAALYFQEEFGQNTESAAAIASIFGWMNLFARGIGGFLSDISSASHGMRGRLWCQVFALVAEGALVCLFSITHTLAASIAVLVIFSIFVQAAEGSTFAIVPYVDYAVTGSIAGVVGAGGNVGGVIFSLFFRSHGNRQAILWMGAMALGSACLTALIGIPGHRSLLRGSDADEVLERRNNHVGQVGARPVVDLHLHTNDAVQSVLRPEAARDTIRDTHIDTSEHSEHSVVPEEV